MSKLIQLNPRKARIARLLGESQTWHKKKMALKDRWLIFAIAACLISTTIAFIVLLTYSVSTKRLQWSYARTTAIATLVAMSILSEKGQPLTLDKRAMDRR